MTPFSFPLTFFSYMGRHMKLRHASVRKSAANNVGDIDNEKYNYWPCQYCGEDVKLAKRNRPKWVKQN